MPVDIRGHDCRRRYTDFNGDRRSANTLEAITGFAQAMSRLFYAVISICVAISGLAVHIESRFSDLEHNVALLQAEIRELGK